MMDWIASDTLTPNQTGGRRTPKLGERIAMQITDRLDSEKLPVGTALGTEADLLAQYGSSRCTIREAIAILERDGVISVRRGRGGGLFVAPTDMDGLRHAMRAYFEYMDVSFDEIFQARRVLNTLAIQLAADRIEQEDIRNLRMSGIRFWAILKATHNPVLDIMARSAGRYELLSLVRSEITQKEYWEFFEKNLKLLAWQAEYIIGGNLRPALELQEEIFELAVPFTHKMMARQRKLSHADVIERMDLFVSPRRPLKKPEVVMYSLLNDITCAGWEVGCHLGSEPELIDRFGVGRSVFREAIRPLEQYGIVEMRTGRKSGLKIAAPTVDRIISEFARRFHRIDLPTSSYTEIYYPIGASIVGQAAGDNRKNKSSNAEEVRESVAERSATQELHALLQQGAGNRILAVMQQILSARLGSHHEGATGAKAVTDAVWAGDPALAYRSFMLMRKEVQGR
jgi:DNA-binding FadR family transcriptional regulator